jgi:hypothetical protein
MNQKTSMNPRAMSQRVGYNPLNGAAAETSYPPDSKKFAALF